MGSALSNVLSACSRWEQPPGIFCCPGSASLTKRRGSCRIVAREEQTRQKKTP